MVVQRVQCWNCATVRMIRCVVHVLPRSGIDGPLCMVITCWYVSYVMQRRLVCDWTHAVRVYTFVQYRSCPACYVASHAVTASRPSCMRLAPHNKTLILLINDRYGHIIQQLNGVEVAQFISLWCWLCRREEPMWQRLAVLRAVAGCNVGGVPHAALCCQRTAVAVKHCSNHAVARRPLRIWWFVQWSPCSRNNPTPQIRRRHTDGSFARSV